MTHWEIVTLVAVCSALSLWLGVLLVPFIEVWQGWRARQRERVQNGLETKERSTGAAAQTEA